MRDICLCKRRANAGNARATPMHHSRVSRCRTGRCPAMRLSLWPLCVTRAPRLLFQAARVRECTAWPHACVRALLVLACRCGLVVRRPPPPIGHHHREVTRFVDVPAFFLPIGIIHHEVPRNRQEVNKYVRVANTFGHDVANGVWVYLMFPSN